MVGKYKMPQVEKPTGYFGKILARGMAWGHRSFYKNTGLFILSNIRRIGFYIILFVLLVVGGVYIFSEFNKKNVYINSFEVSDSLANQGITGIRVADQLLDKIAIIRETKLDRYQKEYLNLFFV